LLICTQSPSRLTLINAYACIRVDLPNGTYTLTQEGDGTVDGELNQASVQQDLDQSPEEPKACVGVEFEEGKHWFHLTHFINENHVFYFSVFMLYFVHLSFRSCFET
jgi:hypothetical protein